MRLGNRPEDQFAAPAFGDDVERIEQRQPGAAFDQLLEHLRCIGFQHRLDRERQARKSKIDHLAQAGARLRQHQPFLHDIGKADRSWPIRRCPGGSTTPIGISKLASVRMPGVGGMLKPRPISTSPDTTGLAVVPPVSLRNWTKTRGCSERKRAMISGSGPAASPTVVTMRDLAGLLHLEAADAPLQALVILQHVPDMLDAEFAGSRQPQATRQPLEKRRPDLLLQRQNLPVDRRGRHIEPRGRLADRTAAGDLVDVKKASGVQHDLSNA